MPHAQSLSCVRLSVTPWTIHSPPGSSVHGILQARILEWVASPSSNPGTAPRSLTLQADSLPSEPQGKPTGHIVGHKITSLRMRVPHRHFSFLASEKLSSWLNSGFSSLGHRRKWIRHISVHLMFRTTLNSGP